jgi:hypothetical protein
VNGVVIAADRAKEQEIRIGHCLDEARFLADFDTQIHDHSP